MTFTTKFGPFVSPGDAITCQVGRFTATATIHHDDNPDAPDQRDEGFWPSRDPQAAGYVLPENFEAEQAKAQRVMDAWNRDEWHYSGVAVTIACEGVELLGPYDCALWGVERNYPDSDNSNLDSTANELLSEAVAMAQAKLAKLCKGV